MGRELHLANILNIFKEPSVRLAERGEYIFKEQDKAVFFRPFKNCKKAIEKMKAHVKIEVHILSCEAETGATRALQEGSVIATIPTNWRAR